MTRWVIETQDLSKAYAMGASRVHALHFVNLRVAVGEFLALMGPSGSGKSTLLHLLGCLEAPSSGSYWLEGQEVGALSVNARARLRNRRIGLVFQTFNLLPRLTALDNVSLPLLYWPEPVDRKAAAGAALARVGLAERAAHRPPQMSGGQRQRVAIARALINNPALILADEPTGNLDQATGRMILATLAELNREGRTILLVTHDLACAAYASRVLQLVDGRLAEAPTAGRVLGPSEQRWESGL